MIEINCLAWLQQPGTFSLIVLMGDTNGMDQGCLVLQVMVIISALPLLPSHTFQSCQTVENCFAVVVLTFSLTSVERN